MWCDRTDLPPPNSAASRASTAAPSSTTRRLQEPVLFEPMGHRGVRREETTEQSDLSMVELVVLLDGRDRNLFYLSDPSIPKKLKNVRCHKGLLRKGLKAKSIALLRLLDSRLGYAIVIIVFLAE